jgi:hypothetical protein
MDSHISLFSRFIYNPIKEDFSILRNKTVDASQISNFENRAQPKTTGSNLVLFKNAP